MSVRIKVIRDFTFLHQRRFEPYKWKFRGERKLQTSQLLALKQSFCNMEQGWGMRNTHSLPLPGRYHNPRLGMKSEGALHSLALSNKSRIFITLNKKKIRGKKRRKRLGGSNPADFLSYRYLECYLE